MCRVEHNIYMQAYPITSWECLLFDVKVFFPLCRLWYFFNTACAECCLILTHLLYTRHLFNYPSYFARHVFLACSDIQYILYAKLGWLVAQDQITKILKLIFLTAIYVLQFTKWWYLTWCILFFTFIVRENCHLQTWHVVSSSYAG